MEEPKCPSNCVTCVCLLLARYWWDLNTGSDLNFDSIGADVSNEPSMTEIGRCEPKL